MNDAHAPLTSRIRLLAVATIAAMLATVAPAAVSPASSDGVSVIVRAVPGAVADAMAEVTDLGGVVGRPLEIINGFVAEVPVSGVDVLRASPSLLSVTRDGQIELTSKGGQGGGKGGKDGGSGDTLGPETDPVECLNESPPFDGTTYCAGDDPSSMSSITRLIKVKNQWNAGNTGDGVDVAIIDTGVTPLRGLLPDTRVVFGPDLSFDAGEPGYEHIDGYGHGTHLAGIIAGRDPEVPAGQESALRDQYFVGVAPDARIVSVKVGDRNGVADVSQVIAAIDWVTQHRNAGDLNIRVLMLAFSTSSTQDWRLDPLAYAVEVAWHRGIVVVTAAGNHGGSQRGLPMPARDPWVIAVGATDPEGTHEVSDDRIPSWSQYGKAGRDPDLVAPGTSIPSLIPPNSTAAQQNQSSLVADGRLLRGSGTSQAAAVVAGAAAVLLEAYPNATPAQVKHALRESAIPIPGLGDTQQGQGIVDVHAAADPFTWPSWWEALQQFELASGTGSLEDARGDAHVESADGTKLEGEVDVRGHAWDGSSWSGSSWSGSSWSGSSWSGSSWSTGDWSGSSWSGSSWSGSSWSGSSWSGSSWSGSSWSGSSWS